MEQSYSYENIAKCTAFRTVAPLKYCLQISLLSLSSTEMRYRTRIRAALSAGQCFQQEARTERDSYQILRIYGFCLLFLTGI